jgi:hypothetical protein
LVTHRVHGGDNWLQRRLHRDKKGYICRTFGYIRGTKEVHRRVHARDTKGCILGTRGYNGYKMDT